MQCILSPQGEGGYESYRYVAYDKKTSEVFPCIK